MAQLPIHRGGGAGLSRRSDWDPFERMHELLSADPFEAISRMWRGNGEGQTFIPAFEVKETKAGFVFKADLPGVEEKDLDVSVTGDRITVSGKRESEHKEESDRYYAYERSFGSFSRTFTLPEDVNAEGVEALLKDGVLTLTLPKRPEVQPKKIPIGSGKSEKAKA
jgi:HSP20 family protein